MSGVHSWRVSTSKLHTAMTSPIDAELAKCLERAREFKELVLSDEFYEAVIISHDVTRLVRCVEEMREMIESKCPCHIHKGSKCEACDVLIRIAKILEGK